MLIRQSQSRLDWLLFILFAFWVKLAALYGLESIPYSGLISFIVSIALYNFCGPLSLFAIMLAVGIDSGSPVACFLHGLFVIILDKYLSPLLSIVQYFAKRHLLRVQPKQTQLIGQYKQVLEGLDDPLKRQNVERSWVGENVEPIFIKDAVPDKLTRFLAGYVLSKYQQDFYQESAVHQVPGSKAVYGEMLMEALLDYFQPFVEQYTSLRLWPTYSTCRVYQKGQDLPHHHDRKACEVTVTLCIDIDKSNVNDDYTWPIYIEIDKEEKQVCEFKLSAGDMLIYKGRENHHWRDKLAANHQVQVLLHYVDKNGPYAHYKYDLRAALGESELTAAVYFVKERRKQA